MFKNLNLNFIRISGFLFFLLSNFLYCFLSENFINSIINAILIWSFLILFISINLGKSLIDYIYKKTKISLFFYSDLFLYIFALIFNLIIYSSYQFFYYTSVWTNLLLVIIKEYKFLLLFPIIITTMTTLIKFKKIKSSYTVFFIIFVLKIINLIILYNIIYPEFVILLNVRS